MSTEPGAGPAEAGRPRAAIASSEPLQRVLAVQDLDTAIARLRHRRETLYERRQLEEVEAERRAVVAEERGLAQRLGELAEAQARVEEQIGAAAGRRSSLESRLYGSAGTAARDLEAMSLEVSHLGERVRALEDQELEIMEEQESLEATRAPLLARGSDLQARSDELRAAASTADEQIDAELADLERRRQAEASSVSPELADRYEYLRARLGGTGAARLVGDRCDGCHLTLPAMEVDRIRHLPPEAVVTCEQCGRLLVRPVAGTG